MFNIVYEIYQCQEKINQLFIQKFTIFFQGMFYEFSVSLGGKRVFSGHEIARKPANEGPVFSRLYGKSKRGKTGQKSANLAP